MQLNIIFKSSGDEASNLALSSLIKMFEERTAKHGVAYSAPEPGTLELVLLRSPEEGTRLSFELMTLSKNLQAENQTTALAGNFPRPKFLTTIHGDEDEIMHVVECVTEPALCA